MWLQAWFTLHSLKTTMEILLNKLKQAEALNTQAAALMTSVRAELMLAALSPEANGKSFKPEAFFKAVAAQEAAAAEQAQPQMQPQVQVQPQMMQQAAPPAQERKPQSYKAVAASCTERYNADTFVSDISALAKPRSFKDGTTKNVLCGVPRARWPLRTDGLPYEKIQDLCHDFGLTVTRDDPRAPALFIVFE